MYLTLLCIMIILAWNIRELDSSGKRREVRNVVRRYKCDLLILSETKLDSFSSSLLRAIGGKRLTQWNFLPSQGASGGILIGWNTTIGSMLDDFKGSYSLSIKFRNLLDNYEWWLTRVYGPCVSSLKGHFIDELRHIHSIVGHHWVLGGDFNVTRFNFEHSSRSNVSPSMTNFNNFITLVNLIDLSPNNYLYTWSNFQKIATMVKLDRFLISHGWESQFPKTICTGKARLISYHISICLDTVPPR